MQSRNFDDVFRVCRMYLVVSNIMVGLGRSRIDGRFTVTMLHECRQNDYSQASARMVRTNAIVSEIFRCLLVYK